MSMMYDAARAQATEGVGPEDYEPPSALQKMIDDGDGEIVIDLLRGMLAAQGMAGNEIDSALERECVKWLADQDEQFQAHQHESRERWLADPAF